MSEQDDCVKRTVTIPKELRDIIGDDDEEYNRIKNMNEERKKEEQMKANNERMSLRGYFFYILSYILFPCLRIYAFIKHLLCCECCDSDICHDGIYGYVNTEDDDDNEQECKHSTQTGIHTKCKRIECDNSIQVSMQTQANNIQANDHNTNNIQANDHNTNTHTNTNA